MIFVNFSNMHTNKWPKDWKDEMYEITDGEEAINVAFPIISPHMTTEQVVEKAEESVEKIMSYNPDVVFCQGEFTMCFNVVSKLKEKGIKVVAACNERILSDNDGKTVSGFRFVQFREF